MLSVPLAEIAEDAAGMGSPGALSAGGGATAAQWGIAGACLKQVEAGEQDEPRPWRWSKADYYKAGELGLFDEKRVELIEGEIYMMPRTGPGHSASSGLSHRVLSKIFAEGFIVRLQQPLSGPGNSEPEPDLAVVEGDFSDYREAHPRTAVLVVEVSKSSRHIDLQRKPGLYAAMAIPEYWVLDLVHRRLEVLRDPEPMEGKPSGHRFRTRFVVE